jgi:fructose-bisphosphate aldolase class II
MKFLPMSRLLERATAEGYAVPAFYAWNAESVLTVLETASRMKAPVILICSTVLKATPLSLSDLGRVAAALAERFDVPAVLMLDHGTTFAHVEECLASGYTSVLLDYSTKPFAENLEATRRVVKMAHPLGVTVESELGVVGLASEMMAEGEDPAVGLTDPDEAVTFVEQTGVDALAVAIGNAHGHYPRLPKLDFERLARVRSAIRIPLVLHGGTGIPEADLRRTISLGISKVNVGTELNTTIVEWMREQWRREEYLWMAEVLAGSMPVAAKVVEKWFRMTGAAGRA